MEKIEIGRDLFQNLQDCNSVEGFHFQEVDEILELFGKWRSALLET